MVYYQSGTLHRPKTTRYHLETNESIEVEDDLWIGGGSVVTKDIPPMSVAVGIPAKVIKRRE